MQLDEHVRGLVRAIDTFRPLLFAEVVDFFRPGDYDHWHRVPECWRREWAAGASTVPALLALPPGRFDPSWPAELRELPELVSRLALPREPAASAAAEAPLAQVFSTGMREKKQHEVATMARLIAQLCAEHGIATVVDLGAGQAHLSHIVAFHYGLNVLAVDNDTRQTAGALRKQATLEERVRRQRRQLGDGAEERALPIVRHLTADIQASGWDGDVESALAGMLLSGAQGGARSSSWLLCGLHTCGDLTPSTLRKFVRGNAKVLVSVGCCYQWITESADAFANLPLITSRATTNPNHHWSHLRDAPDEHGFPLSTVVRDAGAVLGRKARNIANQSFDRWPDTPEEQEALFSRHFYRAVIQVALDEANAQPPPPDVAPETPWTPTVGHLPPDAFASFATYARAVIDKLGVADQLTVEAAQRVHDRFLPRKTQIAIFWRLRSEMGSLIESLILLDRFLYLQEHGMHVRMVPLFDPAVSPRNVALIAVRPNDSSK